MARNLQKDVQTELAKNASYYNRVGDTTQYAGDFASIGELALSNKTDDAYDRLFKEGLENDPALKQQLLLQNNLSNQGTGEYIGLSLGDARNPVKNDYNLEPIEYENSMGAMT